MQLSFIKMDQHLYASDVTNWNLLYLIILSFLNQNKMHNLIIHMSCCIKNTQIYMPLNANLKSLFSKKHITSQMTQYYSYEEQLQIYS